MNKGLLKHRRIVSWWIGFDDLNWPHPDAMDKIKRRAEAMAEADATTAMVFGTHFRWDFLPYFTILHDYMGTVAEELHKLGLELFDHHSVSLVHRYSTKEEMRDVMLHSGPHLPFSPSAEAAAAWEYNGSKLNSWRAVDVVRGEPVYYPQYTAEGFCIRNPEYREAYKSYLARLIADTGIDGLSADDPIHFMEFRTCGCEVCKAEFKRLTGKELPLVQNSDFWGNWGNADWRTWIDMRYNAVSDFFKELKEVVPTDFILTACGGNSASPHAPGAAFDGRRFLRGCNYLNLEMVGNIPPYKNDPQTVNRPVSDKMIAASHHTGAADEHGIRCFGTGFGFTEATADIVWAVNKMLGADCWFSTLKVRLGLPRHILESLPDEADVVGRAFGFEKAHPELFEGVAEARLAVFSSEETRDRTFFGNVYKGYCKDYGETMKLFFRKGISVGTVFEIPENCDKYPLILVPSAAAMTEAEIHAFDKYIKAGGRVIACGPCGYPGADSKWSLTEKPELQSPEDFFGTADIYYRGSKWKSETVFEPCRESAVFEEKLPGFYYTPHRVCDGAVSEQMISLAEKMMNPPVAELSGTQGYLVSTFKTDTSAIVHLLAEDFETDIDHGLDEIRFHRSRVNYINKVEPVGVSQKIFVKRKPRVYTPFNKEIPHVTKVCGGYEISLPEKASYVIIKIRAK